MTFTLVADTDEKPKLLEPDKFEMWDWFDWNDLPKPLFLPIESLKKTNFNPLDFRLLNED